VKSPAALALALLLLAGRAGTAFAVELTRGPYLQNASDRAITVRWRTDVATDSRVWVGAAPGATWIHAGSDATLTTEHEVRLTGLTAATRYFYAVGSSAGPLSGADSTYRFRTAPVPGVPASTRIWVLGDPGTSSGGQARVRDAYLEWTGRRETDVWLLLGDNAYESGTDAEFQDALFEPFASFLRGTCAWAVRGNHDDPHEGPYNDFEELFTFPAAGEAGGVASSTEDWYAFDYGDIHFVALDSQDADRDPGSPMLTWLAADLAATGATWVIVFFHHPPYSKGSHDSDDDERMAEMRENVMPILEAFGVDLVLTGHSHAYERSYLLDGHYGRSDTFEGHMRLNPGDGDALGDGEYHKPQHSPGPHEGEVVVVTGAASTLAGGRFDHPAMARSIYALGSLVVDVEGSLLRAVYLDDQGAIRDRFGIRKSAVIDSGTGSAALRLAARNPVRAGRVDFRYTLPRPGHASLVVINAAGRRVRTIALEATGAGAHVATWDGLDTGGRPAAAGAYFAVLHFEGARRVARFVVVP
jgi:hypothetical protein